MAVNISKKETTRHYMPPDECTQYRLWTILAKKTSNLNLIMLLHQATNSWERVGQENTLSNIKGIKQQNPQMKNSIGLTTSTENCKKKKDGGKQIDY